MTSLKCQRYQGRTFEPDVPEDYTVDQLKRWRWLKCRGSKQSGKRQELITRVKDCSASGDHHLLDPGIDGGKWQGNITSSISLKILYINCMNVVNISRTAVPFIGLSGVLKRTDSVLMVKPVRSLRRQIYNISLEDHLEIELVALLFAAQSHFRFPLLA